MYFNSVADALSMAGHGGYVWSAYLITVVVIGFILVAPRRREKQFLQDLRGAQKRRHKEER